MQPTLVPELVCFNRKVFPSNRPTNFLPGILTLLIIRNRLPSNCPYGRFDFWDDTRKGFYAHSCLDTIGCRNPRRLCDARMLSTFISASVFNTAYQYIECPLCTCGIVMC